MRVLYLTDSLSDLDGVGRYAVRLIRALEQLEPSLEVEVLLARRHRPTSPDVPAHWQVRVALPPDWFYYMRPARFAASHALAVLRALPAARRADLVHAIKDYPHNRVALAAARRAGKPCIATGHGTYTVQPLASPRHRRRALETYAGFDALISVSRYTARRLVELLDGAPPGPERVHVIPNAVDAEHYAAPREIGPRPWHGVPFTAGIGELKERKGHHLALAAWCRLAARHPRLHHFVVGNRAGDEYERRLFALARQAGVADRVHFLGNVSEDEKVDLLQRARVFVHTPVTAADGGFEGFGLVYLEAAACGTPSLGTLGCGAEDAIVDGVSGLLVEPSVEAVEAGLARLLEDEEFARRAGIAAREHARRSSWRENAGRVLALYRAVLRGDGSAGEVPR